jgi:hypothetical protein
MKYCLIILNFLIYVSSFAQLRIYEGIWVSEDNETISIHDTISMSNSLINNNLVIEDFYFQIKSDTLSFQQNYYDRINDEVILKRSYFDFKIVNRNDSLLFLIPITDNAQTFFNKSTIMKFKRQDLIKNDDINFEKLVFHTSSCYGSCPIIHLQINADRKIKLNAHFYEFGRSLVEKEEISGNFIGELDVATYNEFINILTQSRINTYNITNDRLCCDGSVKTIITYFNNKRNYVKTMFAPKILDNLILFLYELNTKVKLVRTNEYFDFENDKDELDYIN